MLGIFLLCYSIQSSSLTYVKSIRHLNFRSCTFTQASWLPTVTVWTMLVKNCGNRTVISVDWNKATPKGSYYILPNKCSWLRSMWTLRNFRPSLSENNSLLSFSHDINISSSADQKEKRAPHVKNSLYMDFEDIQNTMNTQIFNVIAWPLNNQLIKRQKGKL